MNNALFIRESLSSIDCVSEKPLIINRPYQPVQVLMAHIESGGQPAPRVPPPLPAALPAGWSESHDPLFCAERYHRGPDTEEKDRGAATGRDTMTRTPEGQGAVRVI